MPTSFTQPSTAYHSQRVYLLERVLEKNDGAPKKHLWKLCKFGNCPFHKFTEAQILPKLIGYTVHSAFFLIMAEVNAETQAVKSCLKNILI